MKRNFILGLILAVLLLLTGCGKSTNSELKTATEKPVANSATGTVRETLNVVKEEHLSSHYDGAANSGEEGKHIFLIQKDKYGLQEGGTIVFGRTSDFPNGLIRKIESVQEYQGLTKVVTSQAALGDVFEDLNITHSMRLKPAPIIGMDKENIGGGDVIRVIHEEEGVSLSPNSDFTVNSDTPIASAEHDFTIDFNDVDLGDGVKINGSIDMSLSAHIQISYHTKCTHYAWKICDGWTTELGHTYFYIEPEESGTVTLSASEDHSISKNTTVGEYSFPAFDIQIGPVPVVIVPKLSIVVNAEGDVTAGISMGFTEDLSSQIGITHKKNDGDSDYHWYAIKSMDHQFKMIPPEFDASIDAKVSTGPELELKIYDVTGPSANLDAYLEANVDKDANPWWTLYYGIEADATYTLHALGRDLADVTFNIYNYKHELAHADGSFRE